MIKVHRLRDRVTRQIMIEVHLLIVKIIIKNLNLNLNFRIAGRNHSGNGRREEESRNPSVEDNIEKQPECNQPL